MLCYRVKWDFQVAEALLSALGLSLQGKPAASGNVDMGLLRYGCSGAGCFDARLAGAAKTVVAHIIQARLDGAPQLCLKGGQLGIRNEALEDAVLDGRPVVAEDGVQPGASAVVGDVVGYQNELFVHEVAFL